MSGKIRIVVLSVVYFTSSQLAFSQTSAESPTTLLTKRTIQVSGEGEASGKPDKGLITLGVETNARTAAQTMDDNSEAMKALIASLKEAGIEEKARLPVRRQRHLTITIQADQRKIGIATLRDARIDRPAPIATHHGTLAHPRRLARVAG